MNQVHIKAYAKINFYIDVQGLRDDGYHHVAMLMHAVRLSDSLRIEESHQNTISSDSPYVPNNENNLAMKAAMLMQKHYQLPPVHIRIEKNIPVSAGMAGGSTDAAAVLLGLDRLFQLQLKPQTLSALGAQLGSDVPFCLHTACALATGRGEVITPLQAVHPIYIVLIKAHFGVSTARVYQHYDSVALPDAYRDKPPMEAYLHAIATGDRGFILSHLLNTLEPTTFSLYPKVEEMKARLKQMQIPHVLMSGSGPTMFAAFAEPDEAWHYYKKIRSVYPDAYLTSTVDASHMAMRIRSNT